MSAQVNSSVDVVGTAEIGSSTASSTGLNDDGNDGWGRLVKTLWGLLGVIASAFTGFFYWWIKQLWRIDCHWIYQEDPESDVVCSVQAESVFNRLHPARREHTYLPVKGLSVEQTELMDHTLPRRKRGLRNFWMRLPNLLIKLRHNSSYSFNSRTLIHSSFNIRAITMTPDSTGSMKHMLQKAEAKRLFRREGDSRSFFSRATPRIMFTKDGIIDKTSGYEYAQWDPIPSEDYQAVREKLSASEGYLPTASGFIEETVLTMESSYDSETMPTTSSGYRITDV